MADVKRVSATAAAAYCDTDSRSSCDSIHVLTFSDILYTGLVKLPYD